jgi:hypothetical protein
MKRAVLLVLSLVVSVAVLSPLAVSAPQPKLVSTDWALKFTQHDPQAIRLRVPGEPGPRIFWYMLYTVTNQTSQDRMFVPNFVLYTDTGQILHGAEGISPSVFDAIQARHHNPLLENVSSMTGVLLQGEDNAKDGVAIFQDIDPEARAFDLYVGGLSGEGVTVKLPVKVEVTEADTEGKMLKVVKDTIVLHKTLRLHYRLPDDPSRRTASPAIADGSDYVMR